MHASTVTLRIRGRIFSPLLCIALLRVCHRRELALRSREVTAELGLLSLRVQKSEAAVKEGASAAREKEERVLKEHQVGSTPPFNRNNSSISSVNYFVFCSVWWRFVHQCETGRRADTGGIEATRKELQVLRETPRKASKSIRQ